MFPDFFSITVIKRAHCGCVHKLESVVKQNFFLVSLTFVRDTVVGGEEERRGEAGSNLAVRFINIWR